MQIDVGLDATARAEVLLERTESSRAPDRNREDLECSNDIFNLAPVRFWPRRLCGSVEEFSDHEDARDNGTALARLVQAFPNAPADVLRVDDRVRVEQPDHGISGAGALPPASRPSRRIRSSSSSAIPSQGPIAASREPTPRTVSFEGSTRISTSRPSTRACTG